MVDGIKKGVRRRTEKCENWKRGLPRKHIKLKIENWKGYSPRDHYKLKSENWKMKRVFAKGAIQIEKWKLKIEKGGCRGNQKNWKVKNESYPSGAANFHLSTVISSNSQLFKVPRCWSRQCIMSTSIVLVFRKSRYGYKNSLICKCANSLIDSHINTFTHSHVRSFLSY